MEVKPRRPDESSTEGLKDQATLLNERYGRLEPELIIELVLDRFFPSEPVAAISSFGADSAVLLHMVAEIDRSLPVLFLDTQKHFSATIDYRDALVSDLGLTDVRVVRPAAGALAEFDPEGTLHNVDPDACCRIRKVDPMEKQLAPFSAWFTGRKRFQSKTRKLLPVFESTGTKMRLNPLAMLTSTDIESYLYTNNLRRHPLVVNGYLSIGCQPCTVPVRTGEDARAGRWAGLGKSECGIHVTANGEVRRLAGEIGAV